MPIPHTAHLHLAGGLTLEYAEQGPRGGTPMLLLHGITDSWRSFQPVLQHLPAEWHVIALSQRGHGGSDKPPGPYALQDFAADAAAVVRALTLPPVVVVGHSMGAAVAMRMALQQPGLVRGLVGAGAFAGFADKAGLGAFIREQIEPLTDPVPHELAQSFQEETLARPVPPALLATAVAESLRVPAHVWRLGFAGLLADDFASQLAQIAAPTLLVQGSADSFVPAADTERMLAAMPRARATVWQGAGHAMHWEEPARFAEELRRFVGALER